jgi:Zn-dependent metalloprotease
MSAIAPVGATPAHAAAATFSSPSIAPAPETKSALPAAASFTLNRETYSADNRELPGGQLGRLVRREGAGPTGDAAVDAAHDNAGIVHSFYKEVLGRDSIDGRGMKLQSVTHYGRNYNNAFWDGARMTYGDGDGKMFGSFSQSLDVVGHEMAHGVTERTADLRYRGQSGALNESWSDVFGELIEQWHENRSGFSTTSGARAADWMIGEDIFTPGKNGDALRSMKAPGTAHPGDPQPAHMRDYKNMTGDNGGVHINSGIPNKAAYEAAIRLGGEKTAKIWYHALTNYLTSTSQFSDAANATLSAARDLFKEGPEVQAVRDAWNSVGLTANWSSAVERPPGAAPHKPDPEAHGGIVPPWLLTGQAALVA